MENSPDSATSQFQQSNTPIGTLRAWLQLMRLPAVFTAISNVATGFFAVSQPPYAWGKLALLCASSACIYTAGMVLNDVCDEKRDASERKNRPIPSRKIQGKEASYLAIALFCLSFFISLGMSRESHFLAESHFVIGLLILGVLLYNIKFRLSLLMAACRALNVWLGATAVWRLGEQIPKNFLICASIIALWTLAIMWFSKREVTRPHYQKIVKAMILGFIVLDAIFVTFLAGPLYGLAVLSLLVPSVLLARWIYVT